jgi:adenine phosphoribosyltransferase
MTTLSEDVRHTIRDIPDFPKDGVLFKDITPVLARPDLMTGIFDWMAAEYRGQGVATVVGMESRGFFFGPAVAERLGAGFAPARKAGKLPHATSGVAYKLEYGTASLEMHVDAIKPGTKVIIVDDLLATGGTAKAAVDLVRRLGGEPIAACFLIELGFLGGRQALDLPVRSLVIY